MKEDIKCITAESNQYILCTNCIHKNVKHETVTYLKVEDLKKGSVGGVTSNLKDYWVFVVFYGLCLRFFGCI